MGASLRPGMSLETNPGEFIAPVPTITPFEILNCMGPGGTCPPGLYVTLFDYLFNQRHAGAYMSPPSETRAFSVPVRGRTHPFIASDPLTPS